MSKYVIVDLEMCNVNSKETELRHEIIQIGAVLLDESYNIISNYMTYVSPQFGQINKFIENLTGIHQTDVRNAPVLKELWNTLSNSCQKMQFWFPGAILT